MPDYPAGRIRKWLTAAGIAAVFALLLFSWLPYLTEQFLLPAILPAQVYDQYRISVYRLGLRGCTLKITGRPEADPPVAAGNIQVQWTMSGLGNGHLERLAIEGLQVRIADRAAAGETGAPSSPPQAAEPASPAGGSGGFSLPIIIDAIQVTNSTITFGGRNSVHRVPVILDGRHVGDESTREEETVLRYAFSGRLAAHELQGELAFHRQQQVFSGSIGGSIDLHELSRETRELLPSALEIEGAAALNFSAAVQFSPFALRQLQAESRLQDFSVRYGNVLVRSDGRETALLSLAGAPDNLRVTARGLNLAGPLQAAVRVDAAVSFPDESVQWQGTLQARPAAGQRVAGGYLLVQAPPVEVGFTGGYLNSGLQWSLNTVQQEGDPAQPYIVARDNLRLTAAGLGVESKGRYAPGREGKLLNTDLRVAGSGLALKSSGFLVNIPHWQITGSAAAEREGDNSGAVFTGQVQATEGSLHADSSGISLEGLTIRSPVSWPAGERQEPGDIHLENIRLKNTELGSMRARLSQAPDGFGIDGALTSGFIPEDQVSFTGSIHLPDEKHTFAEVTFSAADVDLSLENFSSLVPAIRSISGNGLLNLAGQVVLYRDRIGGFLDLGVSGGTLEIPESGIRAEGIDFGLAFPDLPLFHTAPAQRLAVQRVTGKKFSVSGIDSRFRLESPASLFIEEIEADWSGGRIITSSFRLHRKTRNFEAALLCDRLELAEVLTQLGLARAEGQGKVSGRVPLKYEQGNFYVDDGFLFSTPGETGTLKILESEHLTSGLPGDVPHLSPIYFAGAALKDFQYNWAKLLVSSEEENLRLQLKIDGRPAEKLPYRFDGSRNVFVRLPAGEAGGIDQPIKLDVNFNIPLNELLQYYKEIQPILHNTR